MTKWGFPAYSSELGDPFYTEEDFKESSEPVMWGRGE